MILLLANWYSIGIADGVACTIHLSKVANLARGGVMRGHQTMAKESSELCCLMVHL
jgi:hypothetical protein